MFNKVIMLLSCGCGRVFKGNPDRVERGYDRHACEHHQPLTRHELPTRPGGARLLFAFFAVGLVLMVIVMMLAVLAMLNGAQ